MVVNLTRGVVLARRAVVARGLWARGRGLLGRARLAPGCALVLVPCRAIHTWGMRFPIDALYLDRLGRCLAVVRTLGPWRLGPWVRGAHCVVELPAGAAGETAPGDLVRWHGWGRRTGGTRRRQDLPARSGGADQPHGAAARTPERRVRAAFGTVAPCRPRRPARLPDPGAARRCPPPVPLRARSPARLRRGPGRLRPPARRARPPAG